MEYLIPGGGRIDLLVTLGGIEDGLGEWNNESALGVGEMLE